MSGASAANTEGSRALFVFREVSTWKEQGWLDEAARRLKGLPVELRSQGLLITIAKLLDKARAVDRRLADMLSLWLLAKAPTRPLGDDSAARTASPQQLLNRCREASRRTYRSAQTEALALLRQLKFISEASVASDRFGSLAAVESFGRFRPSEKRNRFAFEETLAWGKDGRETARARCQSLPVEIASAGLLTTVCNLIRESGRDGKEAAGSQALAEALTRWLLSARRGRNTARDEACTVGALLQAVAIADPVQLRADAREAVELAKAIKVYSHALYAASAA